MKATLFIAALSAVLILLITGCGNPNLPKTVAEQPNNVSGPARAIAYSPRVDFMGSDVALGIVAAAKNPMWTCSTCVAGDTSNDFAEAAPQVIAAKPDAVVVVTGENELNITYNNDSGVMTFTNIEALDPQLVAAGIVVLQGDLPALENVAEDDYIVGLGFIFSAGPTQYPWTKGVTLLDYYDATDTDPGQGLPTAAQYTAMVGVTQTALLKLKVRPGAR